ncbi:uncharacterized protein LOC128736033 [Sabethes cyaneus]|uniref:uncharacterized protein LOC128736033 n=1 Tax=Sabethes cyaneus TaxID=53552 RepID=UPI00237DE5F1|nr:uncharacterized protein LOC128736033 [Sabethes cyaneus]
MVPTISSTAEYDGFRCNRGPHHSRKKTGGGTLIAVRRNLKAHAINDAAWSILEQLWLSVQLTNRKLFVCVIYLPPNRTYDKQLIDIHVQSLLTIIARAKPCDEIIIIGDFNLPNLLWRPSRNGFLYPDADHSIFHGCALDLLDGYNTANLQQINNNGNENGRCLDLCFVSTSATAPQLEYAPVPLVKLVPHHPALILTIANRDSVKYSEPTVRTRYNFRRADYEGLLSALHDVDWADSLNASDIDPAVNVFTSIINGLIDRFVPKTQRRPRKNLPWQSAELRRLKTIKNAAFRRFSASHALPLRDHYRRINYDYKRLRRRCYLNYRRQMERRLSQTLNGFGMLSTNSESQLIFNEVLSTGQVLEAASNVTRFGHSSASINIDDNMILAASAKLKHSYSSGPDGIPATLLKKFPVTWKQAFLFPVHKKRRSVEDR